MGGWVSGEVASVHYPGTEPLGTTAGWTLALGDGRCRLSVAFGDLAAFVKF